MCHLIVLTCLPKVFSKPEWASFGFLIANPALLDTEALAKLKIKTHPEASTLVSLLEKTPPKDEETARHWFSTLAGHIAGVFEWYDTLSQTLKTRWLIDFSTIELQRLSVMPFVPVKHIPRIREGSRTAGVRYLPPNQCYFAGDAREQFHSKLFSFIDFGPRAKAFLSACGTKDEPSVEEVARILLDNPQQFLQLADGREKYDFDGFITVLFFNYHISQFPHRNAQHCNQ